MIEQLPEDYCLEEGTPNLEAYELEDVDDSFLSNEDKLSLLRVIRQELEINPKYTWANDPMLKTMIMWKYKETVEKVNVDDYFREKAELNLNVFKLLD